MNPLTKHSPCCLFLCALLLCVSSCSEDTVSTENTSYTIKDIFPISVGAKWEIRVSEYDSIGRITNIDTTEIRIDSTTKLFDWSGYICSFFDKQQGLVVSDSAVSLYDLQDLNGIIYIKYPMPPEQVFILTETFYSGDTNERRTTLRIISENSRTTVPAGTFDCIKFEKLHTFGGPSQPDTTHINYLYFAPKVGYIKEEYYSQYKGMVNLYLTYDLLKYTR